MGCSRISLMSQRLCQVQHSGLHVLLNSKFLCSSAFLHTPNISCVGTLCTRCMGCTRRLIQPAVTTEGMNAMMCLCPLTPGWVHERYYENSMTAIWGNCAIVSASCSSIRSTQRKTDQPFEMEGLLWAIAISCTWVHARVGCMHVLHGSFGRLTPGAFFAPPSNRRYVAAPSRRRGTCRRLEVHPAAYCSCRRPRSRAVPLHAAAAPPPVGPPGRPGLRKGTRGSL